MKYFVLITLILFILSCSLERINPLDPLVSDVSYPEDVYNVNVYISADNFVTITWDTVPNAAGYYVYHSQSYDEGLYDIITPEGITVNDYVDIFQFYPDPRFWYKVSAYILVDDEKLEGFRSDPETW